MYKVEQIEQDVQLVSQPEEPVSLFSHLGEGKDENDGHGAIENHSCESCHCLEKPVGDVGDNSWRDEYLFGHTFQVLNRLRCHVVEVDQVPNRVDCGEEEGGASADLVELQARVQRDVLMERVLLELGEEFWGRGDNQLSP